MPRCSREKRRNVIIMKYGNRSEMGSKEMGNTGMKR